MIMTLLNHIKNFVVVMGDAIADHYSQPHQSGGYYKQMGVKHGHSVPLHKAIKAPYLDRVSGKGVTTESKDYAKIASQTRQVQKHKRDYSSDSDDGESKRNINKKKKKRKKNKRHRIDEALGDDTY